MKRKRYLLVGLVFGAVIGWALGFLRLPYLEKNDSFLLGFISALAFVSLVLLLLAAWNRQLLLRLIGKKTATGALKNTRTHTVLWVLLSAILVWGTAAVYRRGESFKRQMQEQDKKMQAMAELVASVKKNDLGPLLRDLLEDVGEDLKRRPDRTLSDTAIAKIAALSAASKPFKYLYGDSLSALAYSPERGHLLQALALLHLDSGTFAQIKQKTTFASADLRKNDLKGLDMRGVNLREANLESADLSGANLSGADLRKANLWGANLNRANLSHTNLEGTDLRWAQANEADLKSANLSGANLSNAQLRKADLMKAVFKWAQSEGALFNEALLIGADMAGTKLQKVNFRQADLRDAILRSVDLSAADLTGVRLHKAIVDPEWQAQLKSWQPEGAAALREQYTVVNDTVDKWKRPSYRLKEKE